ncbi:MAG: hypothetical protein QM485_09635, partial [Flavobacteriaceae bacterium]
MKTFQFFIIILLMLGSACGKEGTEKIDLSGTWQFKIDSLDRGVLEKWFNEDLSDTIQLPGSMAENGKGNAISLDTKWTGNMWNDSLWYTSPKYAEYRQPGNIKVSFWLSPEKVYYGPAWYQKKVQVPESWRNQQINLHLERTHWETMVWVDDQEVGMKNTLGTPHNYNLSHYLTPGEHAITIRIDNRIQDIDPGLDAHSVSDNTQTNWNGIVGDIKLTVKSPVTIENVKLYTDVANKKVTVKGKLKSFMDGPKKCQLTIEVKAAGNSAQENLESVVKDMTVDSEGRFEIEYPMGESPLLWDEFNPNLYVMQLSLESGQGTHQKEITFGMREFKVDGKHFSVNGRTVFLRGTLECAIFPLTGYPPTDVDEWKRILKIVQNHG